MDKVLEFIKEPIKYVTDPGTWMDSSTYGNSYRTWY